MMPRYLPFRAAEWQGLVLSGWEGFFADLDGWLASRDGERIVNLLSRQVWRVSTPQGAIFVKVIRRASEVQGPVRQTIASLKWLLRPSRALAILRVSQVMLKAGFECPVPVLAVRRRSARGWPEDVFISIECRLTNLYDLLSPLSHENRDLILRQVATELNRYHRAGFVHGDCIPANIAMNAKGHLVFFDNDRTRSAPLFRRRYAQRRNLIQFGYRLTQQLDGDISHFERFLIYYVEEAEGAAAARQNMAGIIRNVRKRLRS
jgi:tRNA A-37 threonylcarbamoyl transferase component Bud32